MACKKGQFDVVELFKTFSINLNAQNVNGMTPFDLKLLFQAPISGFYVMNISKIKAEKGQCTATTAHHRHYDLND